VRLDRFRRSEKAGDARGGERLPPGAGTLVVGTIVVLALFGVAFGTDPRALVRDAARFATFLTALR
jgi:hypothetical protein